MHPPRLVLLVVSCALVAGCGSEEARAPAPATATAEPAVVDLALDFTPNAVHAPIYAAAEQGLDRKNGVRLRIRKPGGGPDALKLVTSGKVAIGVLDIHDLAIARERGADLVGVGALVTKPLAALIAQPGVRRPRDLEGRTVGVSGLASDPAFVKAIVEDDGGDVSKIRQVTIGFAAVAQLVSKRVDAVPAFWNAEGVALRREGVKSREFRVEDFGAPPYPEVVVFTSRSTLNERRADVEGALRALADGVRAVRAEPARVIEAIAKAANTRDLALIRAQLEAVDPLFGDTLALDRPILEQWADFDERIGLTKERVDVDQAFDFTLTG